MFKSSPFASPALKSLLERLAVWIPLAFFAVMVGAHLIQNAPYPQDDLLRNVVAYAWGYDYRALYAFSPGLPEFDPYIGFDWLLGGVAKALGAHAAVLVSQLVGTVAFLAVLIAPLRRRPDFAFHVSWVLMASLATFIISRLIGARPEVFITVWCLAAASLSPRRWLVLGLLLAPFYWLAPMYACGAFLLRVTWLQRIFYSVAAFSGTTAFWVAYAGKEWAAQLRKLPGMAALRPEPIEEAEPVAKLLTYLGTWPLVLALALAGGLLLVRWVRSPHRRGFDVLAKLRERAPAPAWWVVAGTFLVIGSTRHILVIGPALLLWAATQRWSAATLNRYSALALFGVVTATLACHQIVDTREDRAAFKVPTGSLVLTGYTRAVFMMPHYNPGTVQVIPSIEPAWDAEPEKALALAAQKGTLSCEQVATRPITHVVTREKIDLAGPCFVLDQEFPRWKLWRVNGAFAHQ